jgi:hypothetical protein
MGGGNSDTDGTCYCFPWSVGDYCQTRLDVESHDGWITVQWLLCIPYLLLTLFIILRLILVIRSILTNSIATTVNVAIGPAVGAIAATSPHANQINNGGMTPNKWLLHANSARPLPQQAAIEMSDISAPPLPQPSPHPQQQQQQQRTLRPAAAVAAAATTLPPSSHPIAAIGGRRVVLRLRLIARDWRVIVLTLALLITVINMLVYGIPSSIVLYSIEPVISMPGTILGGFIIIRTFVVCQQPFVLCYL